ncbi:hypothetical protein CTAYLR_004207 [Chrysophaeum taylorii]|uniref:CKK domain-containing protein n=1 Tax=Chrysophaeum taylorii TaxID=2483200 RepID=A0AAD7XK45_9STRA|nr:hypothetical protein CTAYLR_004207 [Chrysophaeum taylorii]
MHSAKCVFAPPAHGSAQGACVDFAAEFLRDDAAFQSTSTLFEQPKRLEATLLLQALHEASRAQDKAASLEDAIAWRRDAVRLAGKCVDVRRDPAPDERFLLPQLSAMFAALRGTSGCVIVSAPEATLCVGVDGREHASIAEDETVDDEDELDLIPAALSTVCYDPTPRPLFKLRGASALRFNSVRGLQLHALAILSSVEETRGVTTVRLALLVSSRRRDAARIELIERTVSRIRRSEKKRAIALQRAEIEALRDRLRRDVAPPVAKPREAPAPSPVDDRPPSASQPVLLAEEEPTLPETMDCSGSGGSAFGEDAGSSFSTNVSGSYGGGLSLAGSHYLESSSSVPAEEFTTSRVLSKEHEGASSSGPWGKREDEDARLAPDEMLVQAALAAYSSSLLVDDCTRDISAALAERTTPSGAVQQEDVLLRRESADSAIRELVASIDGEDAVRFGLRLYDVMRERTLRDMVVQPSLDMPPPPTRRPASVEPLPPPLPPRRDARLPPESSEPATFVRPPAPPKTVANNAATTGGFRSERGGDQSGAECFKATARHDASPRTVVPDDEVATETLEEVPKTEAPAEMRRPSREERRQEDRSEVERTTPMKQQARAPATLELLPSGGTREKGRQSSLPAEASRLERASVSGGQAPSRAVDAQEMGPSRAERCPMSRNEESTEEEEVERPSQTDADVQGQRAPSPDDAQEMMTGHSHADDHRERVRESSRLEHPAQAPPVVGIPRGAVQYEEQRQSSREDSAQRQAPGARSRRAHALGTQEMRPLNGNGQMQEDICRREQPAQAPPPVPGSRAPRKDKVRRCPREDHRPSWRREPSSEDVVEEQPAQHELAQQQAPEESSRESEQNDPTRVDEPFFDETRVGFRSETIRWSMPGAHDGGDFLASSLEQQQQQGDEPAGPTEEQQAEVPARESPRRTIVRTTSLEATEGFLDAETNDEELVFFFGEGSTNGFQELVGDPVLIEGTRSDVDVGDEVVEVDFLRAAAAKFDSKSRAAASERENSREGRTRPTGWAATFDLASNGDIFATRGEVPKRPELRSQKTQASAALSERNAAQRLGKMQRFNEMRAKKARAMEERRRLEKEHRAALRAGAFQEDDENEEDVAPDAVKSAIRRATRTTPPRTTPPRTTPPRTTPPRTTPPRTTPPRTTPPRQGAAARKVPSARKMTNNRSVSNALVQVCLAGPHCATALADAVSAMNESHFDHHVVLLKDDAVRSFRGLYAVQLGRRRSAGSSSGGPYCCVEAEKIYGRGPARFGESNVAAFFKYDSATRAFQALPSKSFTFTTDAVIVQNTQFRARQLPPTF